MNHFACSLTLLTAQLAADKPAAPPTVVPPPAHAVMAREHYRHALRQLESAKVFARMHEPASQTSAPSVEVRPVETAPPSEVAVEKKPDSEMPKPSTVEAKPTSEPTVISVVEEPKPTAVAKRGLLSRWIGR